MSRHPCSGRKSSPWRSLAKLLALCLAVVAPAGAAAQTPSYKVLQRPQPFQLLGTGATSLGNLGDSGVGTVNLPFPIRFFGVSYSTIYVNANQFVSFTHSATGSHFPSNFLSTSAPHAMIAAFWADATCASDTVKWQTLGAAPSRQLVIEWNCNEWGDTSRMPTQIWFSEDDESIEVRYGVPTGVWDEGAMGLKNQDGSEIILPIGKRGRTCGITCDTPDVHANGAFVYERLADLQVTEVVVPPEAWGGVPVHIEATIANTGGKASGSFDVRYVLSQNATVDASDIELGTLPGPGLLGPQSTGSVTADLIIPALITPGTWFVLVEADPGNVVVEMLETNNVKASPAIVIGEPVPDLLVESIELPAAPQLDGTLRFSWTARNRGAATATGVPYKIIASANDYISTSDVTLGTGTLSIGALTTTRIDEVVALPSSLRAGPRHIGVIIDPDNVLFEPDETNNAGISEGTVLLGSTGIGVVSTNLPAAELGGHFCTLLDAAGGDGRYVWSVASGTLPPGLDLIEERDGGDPGEPPLATLLCGTPSTLGTWEFSLEVTSAGLVADHDYTVVVNESNMALTVATFVLRDAIAQDDYKEELLAVGGVPPYEWSLVDRELPDGIRLLANGQLRGKPISQGDHSFRVRVGDEAGGSAFVDLELTVTPPVRVTCMTERLPDQLIGTQYDETLNAAGGKGPYVWTTMESSRRPTFTDPGESYSNRPPDGMTLHTDGRVGGIPLKAGSYLWQVEVEDEDSNLTDTCSIEFRVTYDQGITVTTTALATAYAGTPYAVELEASGGRATYTWTVGPGSSLPNGLAISPEGVISGVMALAELEGAKEKNFAFTVLVTDSQNVSEVTGLSVTLQDEPSVYKAPEPPEPGGGNCQAGVGDPGLLALGVALGLTAWRRRR